MTCVSCAPSTTRETGEMVWGEDPFSLLLIHVKVFFNNVYDVLCILAGYVFSTLCAVLCSVIVHKR